jgi:hypothetical protein
LVLSLEKGAKRPNAEANILLTMRVCNNKKWSQVFNPFKWWRSHRNVEFEGGKKSTLEVVYFAGRWWLTHVILATQEAEIRRIEVQSQPRQIVLEPLSQKYSSQKRTSGVAWSVGPEFKPRYHKKKKNVVYFTLFKN